MRARLAHHGIAGARAAVCMAVVLCVVPGAEAQPASPASPAYTADGRLEFPKTYRTWVYLSSGLDMSYLPSTAGRMSTFGNVFVNPVSHESFLKTGTWPDKTVLVLEIRRAEENGSINKSGRFQSDSIRTEVHVKDTARFGGGWAFFAYSDETPAQMIPRSANCYSCHQANGAVDTTFVQFYPTLLPIARAKQTLTTGYLATESRDAPRK